MSSMNWHERRMLDLDIARKLKLNVYYTPDNPEFTENRDFEDMYIIETNPYRCYEVPYYSTYLGAAITLWDIIPFEYTPRLVRMVTPKDGELAAIYKAHIMENTLHIQFECEDHNPALAICKAWLAWHDAQSATVNDDESEAQS